MKTKIFKGDHPISSPYGWRVLGGVKQFHNGVDFSMPIGEDLTVPDTFNGAKVRLNTKDKFGGIYTQLERMDGKGCYWLHNSKNLIPVGRIVYTGDVIAKSGNSGNSTGPHVHFGVQSKATVWGSHEDPMPYLTLSEKLKAGSKLEMIEDMNARDSGMKVIGKAKKGSVCEVLAFSKNSNNYDYYRVKFADKECYLANTNYNQPSTKEITNLDGSKPVTIDPCKELEKQAEKLQNDLDLVMDENKTLTEQVESLEKYKEFKEDLSKLLEVK